MAKVSLSSDSSIEEIEQEINSALNRFKSEARIPAIEDLPSDGDWMFFENRTLGKFYLIRNCKGVIKSTELT